MSAPRYVLMPGYVTSRTDGQRHFINAQRLCNLYGVRMAECVVYPIGYTSEDDIRRRNWRHPPGAIELYPRFDGRYTLPAAVALR